MVAIDIATMLPFFFILAVVYGSLETAGALKNKGANAVIAIVISFFAITSPEVISSVTAIMPYAALFFIAFFMINFAKSAMGKKNYSSFIVGLALILIFISSGSGSNILQDQNTIGLVVLAIIGMLIYYSTRKNEETTS